MTLVIMKNIKTTNKKKFAKVVLVYTEDHYGIFRNGILVDEDALSLGKVHCTPVPSAILDALKIPYTSHWLGYRPPGWHFPKKFKELEFE
jgi:hypothetical protein